MTADAKPTVPRRRRFRRALLLLVVVLVALVIASPYIASTRPVSRWLLPRLFADVHGTVTAERLELGWFSPPRVSGFEIRSAIDEPVISIASIKTEQPLWQLLSHPAEIGRVTVEEPHAYLIVTANGSNFATTFRRDPNRKIPARWREEAMRVAVDKGAFTWQLAGSTHQWSLSGMELGVGLMPAWLTDTHEARFEVDPKTVVDHAELTPGMCEDVLKFIAPVLAAATTSSGNFSLTLSSGSVPFDHPRDADLSGVLTLHTVNIGPGPWFERIVPTINKLLPSFKLPREVTLARESAVKFELAKQRIHHEGLEFGTPELNIRTSGFVGFDESLDLVAEVRLQLPESDVANRPVLRALNGQVLRLPVKGTLKHPEIDWGTRPELRQGFLAALEDKIAPDASSGLLEGLRSSGILGAPSGPTSATRDLGIVAGELFKRFSERRRERAEKRDQAQSATSDQAPAPADAQPGAGAPTPPPPSPPANEPPSGTSNAGQPGRLGQILRAAVQAAAQAVEQQGSQPPASSQSPEPPATSAPPPPTPAPVAPVPSDQSGPALIPPTNMQPPPGQKAAAAAQSGQPAPPAAAASAPLPPTGTPSVTTSQTSPTAAPTAPIIRPPPLVQPPLPAATAAPSTTANAGTAVAAPPAAPARPQRRIGGAIRALIGRVAEPGAQAPPTAAQPTAPPVFQQQPSAPAYAPPQPLNPQGEAAPPAGDAPRRPVLRRVLRAAIDAAVQAASQPPVPPQSGVVPPPPAPADVTSPPPAPAPAPAPAPEAEELPPPRKQ